MTSSFFSPDIVNRKADVDISTLSATQDVQKVYEIERCVNWIKSNDFKRVAVQLPDGLLCDSSSIIDELEKSCTAAFFILGDTSYGSCCVDEVAAQHSSADSIIHFGQSCLSPTKRLPVLFVFGQMPISEFDCVQKFQELFPEEGSKVIVMFDTCYAYACDSIHTKISNLYKNVIMSSLNIPGESPSALPDTVLSRCNRNIRIKESETLEDYFIFYIGSETPTLTNLMMNYNKCTFFSYDPSSQIGRKETLNVNKSLMKRYYMIERIKDANIVGIVAGTLGVANYLEVINRVKLLIKRSGKKSYMFVVGKLNVAKLANFMEIDVFVLVSCPENTLIDSSEFYKPVVTPFEVEIALNSERSWTGTYITDFQELLPGGANYVDVPAEAPGEAATDVSLISGQMRKLGTDSDKEDSDSSTALVSRDKNMSVATVQAQSAGEFLSQRVWQGLDRDLGKTPVTKATEGRKGIAASYEHELSNT